MKCQENDNTTSMPVKFFTLLQYQEQTERGGFVTVWYGDVAALFGFQYEALEIVMVLLFNVPDNRPVITGKLRERKQNKEN